MDARTLEPLPYARRLADCLAEHEPALWARLTAPEGRVAASERARLELLRDAADWEDGGEAAVNEEAEQAKRALGLESLPVVMYRSVGEAPSGARLVYLPEAAHLVLDPVMTLALEPEQRVAIFGRELARHLLLTVEDGRYGALEGLAPQVSDRVQLDAAQERTIQRLHVFQELFCDRGAALAAGSAEAALGLIDQADAGSGGLRKQALELWWDEGTGAERQVAELVKGELDLDALDYVDQVELQGLTRRWLALVVQPAWMRSDPILGHCRQMFPGFAGGPLPEEEDVDDSLVMAEVRGTLPQLEPYWVSLLLDLAVADGALGDAALVRGMQVADGAGLRDELETMAREELGLGVQLVQDLWRDREALIAAKEQG